MGSERIFRWGVLIILAFIWGSSFILMKIGLIHIPFQQLAALRIFIAFLALLPVGIQQLKTIQRRHWKFLILGGLLGNGIPAFLFAFAQTHISSSLAGMLNSLVPLFTLTLGAAFFSARAKNIHITGVLIGLVGACFIVYQPGMSLGSDSIYGIVVIISTICYATNVNLIKTYLHDLSSTAITAVALFFIGPVCAAYLFLGTNFATDFRLDQAYLYSMGAVIALSVFSTGLAIIIFNMLIKRVSALYASSVTYLIPIIAIFWGVMDGETVSVYQLSGMGAIFTGIYLINK